jgi:hypothetical protein
LEPDGANGEMLSTAYPVFASKHARIPPQFSTLLLHRSYGLMRQSTVLPTPR